jgi:hypothetical protein
MQEASSASPQPASAGALRPLLTIFGGTPGPTSAQPGAAWRCAMCAADESMISIKRRGPDGVKVRAPLCVHARRVSHLTYMLSLAHAQ